MKIKTFSELEAIVTEYFPDGLFSEGKNGEIIIETGLKYDPDGENDELKEI